jgi:sortase (surface protein transpeptidase)
MKRLFLPCVLFVWLLSGCGQQPPAATSGSVPTEASQPASQPTAEAATTTPTPLPPLPTPFDSPALRNEAAAPTPEPTAAFSSFAATDPVRVTIDAIGLNQRLIQVGLDENRVPIVPRHDVGWYEYSARPGDGENIVLWGHVLRFQDAPDIPAPFARLSEAPLGAPVTVYAADGTPHTYTINEQIWVTPEQVDYILPQGSEMLTLVSCIGDTVIVEDSVQMSHRLITIAVPES